MLVVKQKLEELVACGYAFAVVEHGKDKIVSDRIKRSPICLEDLIFNLLKLAEDIYNRNQVDRIFRFKPHRKNQSVSVGSVKHPLRTIKTSFGSLSLQW